MSDPIEKVKDAWFGAQSGGPSARARAAYAAVLDDLMEPTEAMLSEGHGEGDALHNHQDCDWMEIAPHIFRAMLTAKRRELGLSAPEKSGESPLDKYKAQIPDSYST